MNYYPRFPAHYQTKTLHLTMEQDGAYSRLLDWYYANERPIPHASRYAVARAMTPSEKKSTDAVLREFFELKEDVWTQYRAEAEIAKARPKIDAAKENGKKGGRPSKKPPAPPAEPAGEETQGGTEEKPNGFPAGSDSDNPAETHGDPGAKAPQSPISITTSEALHTPDSSQSADAFALCVAGMPGKAAAALRKRGCAINSTDPRLLDAVAAGVTAEQLTELHETYPDKPAGYLIQIAMRQLSERAAGASATTTTAPGHATTLRTGPESLADRSASDIAAYRRRRAEEDASAAGGNRGSGGDDDAIDAEWEAV
ncbi:YdaU family protein [Xanthomonas translucens pv. translucens]|uniref:YdaU family protein n=1 Tax=Xanthomonas campestris pv. translucens TaxID=343 RepID=UPI003F71989E